MVMQDLWLPKGYESPDGAKIRSLLYVGSEWQIFDTDGENNIMLARPELVQKWNEFGFLDESLFGEFAFGTELFKSLSSHKKYILAPVENGKSPKSKVDALAFALALKESRKLAQDVSFHDAIYLEQYSRLLPSWTLTPQTDDKIVLGTWLTGGVGISTESFRRLASLVGWLPVDNLVEIIKAAEFEVPAEIGLLTEKAEAFQQQQLPQNSTVAKVFSLPGRPQLEEFFNEHVIDIIFNTEKYQALGIEFPSPIVLYGPTGCGKTFAVERLVEFIDWPSYSINSNSVGSPYIHETSKKISQVFDQAIDNAPSVVIIDEMESFLSDRSSGHSSSLHHLEEVAEFLRQIPEAIKNKVLIIAMTNMLEIIDPAILRRGRFDHLIEVGMPSREEVSSLVDSLLSTLPRASNLNPDKIFDLLTGKPLSDAAFVIRESARLAAKAGKAELDQESLEAATKRLFKSPKKIIGFISDGQ